MTQTSQLHIEQTLLKAEQAALQGKAALATQLYKHVLRHQPEHAVAKNSLERLQKASSEPEAMEDPTQEQIEALNQLCRSGQLAKAEQACQALLRRFPRSLAVINTLGMILHRQGKWQASLPIFEKGVQHHPDSAGAHYNCGKVYADLGQLEKAVQRFQQAVELNPDHVSAWINLGNALRELGRVEQAIECFQQTLRCKSDYAEAHINLSALKRYEQGDEQLLLMERLFVDAAASDNTRMLLGFSLAKACDDLAEYDRSFSFLKGANRLRKKELNYTVEVDEKLTAQVQAAFSTTVPVWESVQDESAIRPVFIVGMFRSGTSLVEQIIASHSQVYGAGELPVMSGLARQVLSDQGADKPLSRKDVRSIRDGYLAALRALNADENIVLDKMPTNFLWIGFILSAFPEAKIIHLNRDPRATCWSIYKHCFSEQGNGYAYDLVDLAKTYALYREMMAFWRERFPNRIYDICYENLTENQELESQRLLAYCGLEWEAQCLDFHRTQRAVNTASSEQVRQKMYQGSSEAWRRYEKHLEPLLVRLEDSVKQFQNEWRNGK